MDQSSSTELQKAWVNPAVVWGTASASIWMLNGNPWKGLPGQWPCCCCTSTGQDGSIELEMAWIGPNWLMTMPLHIYGPRKFHTNWYSANKSSGCRVITSARMDIPGRAQRPHHCTCISQDSSIELEMAQSAWKLWSYSIGKVMTDGRKV